MLYPFNNVTQVYGGFVKFVQKSLKASIEACVCGCVCCFQFVKNVKNVCATGL